MAKHTKRDRIWDAALVLSGDGRFVLGDVLAEAELDASSERTARDVLLTMEDFGRLKGEYYRSASRRGKTHRCWMYPYWEWPTSRKAPRAREEGAVSDGRGSSGDLIDLPEWARGRPDDD